MADWLLLRLPRTLQEHATWLVVDARGAAVGPPQGGPLSLAAPRAAGRHVVVLVPGTEVLLAQPELPPAKAGARLQQLVAYALEEQLAEDIDELHFAIGRRHGDSAVDARPGTRRAGSTAACRGRRRPGRAPACGTP